MLYPWSVVGFLSHVERGTDREMGCSLAGKKL